MTLQQFFAIRIDWLGWLLLAGCLLGLARSIYLWRKGGKK